MTWMSGENQVSAASVIRVAVEHRSPWELAKDIDIDILSQNKLKDKAGEACSQFQNTSKASGSEQEMSKEEVAHHETSQPWPAMSVEPISEKCSKNPETLSGKVRKPSFQRMGPKVKLPHSLFQKASMAEAESSDFVEMFEESDATTLTSQPLCQAEIEDYSIPSGLLIKEDEAPQSEPQVASIPVKKKVPTFGKVPIKSKKTLVGSGAQMIKTSRINSNCHNPRNAKLTAGFNPKTQKHSLTKGSFTQPIHNFQGIKEKDTSKTCTKHEEMLSKFKCTDEGGNQQCMKKPVLCETNLHEKNVNAKEDDLMKDDDTQTDTRTVVNASGRIDAAKEEIFQAKVQAFDKELIDDSNTVASRASQFTVGIHTPVQLNKGSETEQNENREINNINKLVEENPGYSFSVPHTKDEKKSDGRVSVKDGNPSKMTEEQWENLFRGVINLTDEHTLDSALKVDCHQDQQDLETDNRCKVKKRKRQERNIGKCKKFMAEAKHGDTVHESEKDCDALQSKDVEIKTRIFEPLLENTLNDISKPSGKKSLKSLTVSSHFEDSENFPYLELSEESSSPSSSEVQEDYASSMREGDQDTEEPSPSDKTRWSKRRSSESSKYSDSDTPISTHTPRKIHLLQMLNHIDEDVWVQCDKCNKWRKCWINCDPAILPDYWTCIMSKDPLHNRCSFPEDNWRATNEVYLYHRYILGSVVWARVPSTPWWPAIVDLDPDYRCYLWGKSKENHPEYTHVTFFGEPVSRAWVTSKSLTLFKMKHSARHFAAKVHWDPAMKSALEAAVFEAQRALMMDIHNRRKKYSFVSRHHGKIGYNEDFISRNYTKKEKDKKRELESTSPASEILSPTESKASKEIPNKKMKRVKDATGLTCYKEEEDLSKEKGKCKEKKKVEQGLGRNENKEHDENVEQEEGRTEDEDDESEEQEVGEDEDDENVEQEMCGTEEHDENDEQEVGGTEEHDENYEQEAGGTEEHDENDEQEAGGTGENDENDEQEADGTGENDENDEQEAGGTGENDEQEAGGTEEHDENDEQEAGGTGENDENDEQEAGGTGENDENDEQEAGGTGENDENDEQEVDGTEENDENDEQEADGTGENDENDEQEADGTGENDENDEQEAGGTGENDENDEQEADGTEENDENDEQEADGTEENDENDEQEAENDENDEQEAGGTEEHDENDEQEAGGTGENDENEQEAGGTGENNENEQEAGGNGENDENEQEAGGTGENDENEQEAGGTGENDENDEQEADGTGENDENDEQEAGGTGENDKQEAGGTGENDENDEQEAGGTGENYENDEQEADGTGENDENDEQEAGHRELEEETNIQSTEDNDDNLEMYADLFKGVTQLAPGSPQCEENDFECFGDFNESIGKV
ncbi:uncharacterized protein LOC125043664 [Penaeus chinensis]|uniref:uncharacterized protein LOC125043664 n=1 Tax=Penaeus chinensis TaxID=139456 RepID=UPI001FB6B001|nr:uncharacterized protein LOC125043664 [Penaeus chinensis]